MVEGVPFRKLDMNLLWLMPTIGSRNKRTLFVMDGCTKSDWDLKKLKVDVRPEQHELIVEFRLSGVCHEWSIHTNELTRLLEFFGELGFEFENISAAGANEKDWYHARQDMLNLINHLSDRVRVLESGESNGVTSAAMTLRRMSPLQVVMMQMYHRGYRNVEVARRLGRTEHVVGTYKKRITTKLGEQNPKMLGECYGELERHLTDDQFLEATMVPKDWCEKYAEKEMDEDPYAELYNQRIRK